MQQASGAAVTTLLKLMVDPTTPASTRARAADIVLDHSAKAWRKGMKPLSGFPLFFDASRLSEEFLELLASVSFFRALWGLTHNLQLLRR